MKNIYDLSNPDLIVINDEEYQVIENMSQWFDSDKEEFVGILDLIKVEEKNITPTYYISYICEDPNNLERWKFVKMTELGKGVIEIKSININHT